MPGIVGILSSATVSTGQAALPRISKKAPLRAVGQDSTA